MKLFIFLLFASTAHSQIIFEETIDTANVVNVICFYRGHVMGDIYSSTDMYCHPYLDENSVRGYIVYPSCNVLTYNCIRCGDSVREREKERRVLLWGGEPIQTMVPILNKD
jgi:hypothetical protein